ncbi:hydrolase [Bradyrhizobium sp. SSBR45G]|uniref:HAD family hydrolase n=1 Tax=unclassified Bradyrhizobium TaxID=2631580 RepID=UPI002342A851|nr:MULTISPECIES: HAD-IA family hydrolase [unclassified Bradyrhizobium]GLH80114.1 hydrolase [Bradyrhizobium sp. SSBR45G]GLH87577.1 hydrolase [Bradyrhizobium sp. SSBR45R]
MQLIIFDFDGTLVDSRALILECHRTVFTEFGLPVPAAQDSLALIGRSLELVLAELARPDAPVIAMVSAYARVLPQLRADPSFAETPFDGIGELLFGLSRRRDTQLGIATGHTSKAVVPALETLGWRDWFSTIQAADMAPSKPHPAMLLQALVATGVAADDAVFIGDTSFDMVMAKAAGVTGIGVTWGYHTAEQLTEAGADRVVETVNELRHHLATAP